MKKYAKRPRTRQKQESRIGLQLSIFRGLILSLLISIAGVLMCAGIITISGNNVGENYLYYGMCFLVIISILLGSTYAASKAKNLQLVTGIVIGLVYMVVSLLIGLDYWQNLQLSVMVVKILLGMGVGAVGSWVGAKL